jgi:hypothetical protein
MKRIPMKYVYLLLLLSLVFLLGCEKAPEITEKPEVPTESPAGGEEIKKPEGNETQPPVEIQPEEEGGPEEKLLCTHNQNCTGGKLCIHGECQKLEKFYPQENDCETKCRVSKVTITTSDGDTYEFSPGQGSYTAVGALEWKILSLPPYCSGEKPLIPIKILKRNYGQIFSDEVIMLKEGEASKVIKHPFVKRVAFTLRIENIEEICS